ncbi:hypothetical protein KAU11_09355 [Candidatus Babeliales bacterium]|nr:hypothetical protein [Candidatus Babeliales bacterium]
MTHPLLFVQKSAIKSHHETYLPSTTPQEIICVGGNAISFQTFQKDVHLGNANAHHNNNIKDNTNIIFLNFFIIKLFINKIMLVNSGRIVVKY